MATYPIQGEDRHRDPRIYPPVAGINTRTSGTDPCSGNIAHFCGCVSGSCRVTRIPQPKTRAAIDVFSTMGTGDYSTRTATPSYLDCSLQLRASWDFTRRFLNRGRHTLNCLRLGDHLPEIIDYSIPPFQLQRVSTKINYHHKNTGADSQHVYIQAAARRHSSQTKPTI